MEEKSRTFVESTHDFCAVHWDHEPIRIPLSRPSATLSPAQSGGEGRERGRFMESLLGLVGVHWDHEPADRAAASWTAPVLWRFRLGRLHRQSASVLECGGKRSATPLWILRASRVMGEELSGLGREPMQSAVAATLCRRTPKPGETSKGPWKTNSLPDEIRQAVLKARASEIE